MVKLLIQIYTMIIWCVPPAVAVLPLLLTRTLPGRLASALVIVPLYGAAQLFTCGFLSRPHRWAIRDGRFHRSIDDPIYGPRRLHALCWTSIYYSPIYPAYLINGLAKRCLFRLFGYQGELAFTCYPDTWIRDLPILRIGRGSYLSNKSTIGTNLALQNGCIFVEGIVIGKEVMVGHLTMIAAGTTVGDHVEIGHGTGCGVRVQLGELAIVSGGCGIDHKSQIGERAEIGMRSYIGLGAHIGPGIKLPPGANVPCGAKLATQADVDRYLSSETESLNALRLELSRILEDNESS